jgi:hypothetical protein
MEFFLMYWLGGEPSEDRASSSTSCSGPGRAWHGAERAVRAMMRCRNESWRIRLQIK